MLACRAAAVARPAGPAPTTTMLSLSCEACCSESRLLWAQVVKGRRARCVCFGRTCQHGLLVNCPPLHFQPMVGLKIIAKLAVERRGAEKIGTCGCSRLGWCVQPDRVPKVKIAMETDCG